VKRQPGSGRTNYIRLPSVGSELECSEKSLEQKEERLRVRQDERVRSLS